MTYYRKFPTAEPEFLDLGDMTRLADVTERIIASELVQPLCGFAKLSVDTEKNNLEPLEVDLVTEVSELTYESMSDLIISGVEFLWTTDDQKYIDFRERASGIPFANSHTDVIVSRSTDHKTGIEISSFIKPKIGRLAIALAGNGPLCLDGCVLVPEQDCHEYKTSRPNATAHQMVMGLSLLTGVITGVDGSFVRGYPDNRVLEGLYDQVVIQEGQAAIIGEDTIHQSYPWSNSDKRIILVDYYT